MVHPEGSQAIKVGVLLDREPEDLGDWLADGTAFEAAGANALWVDFAPDLELDPLALTAALAAVTSRSLLVTTLSASDDAPRARARMLATIGQLSHGRLSILADAIPFLGPAEDSPGMGVFRRVLGEPETYEHMSGPTEVDRWVSAPCPDSRATWQATLLDAAERGAQGLLVPAGSRLLDILRNPDDPGYRLDLQLAQG